MSKNLIKSLFFSLFFVAFFLAVPFTAKAFEIKSGDSIYIPKDQIIDGNLYAAGSNITVDGEIQGDVICAGQVINIKGKVQGDVICAGQTLNIDGEVLGSVRVAGNGININNSVAKNVNAFGASVILGDNARIGWDALIAGATMEHRGQVNGNLHGGGTNLIISGKVGKNVTFNLEQNGDKSENKKSLLTITDVAVIGGDVTYTALNPALINQKNVSGKIVHNIPNIIEKNNWPIKIWSVVYMIFAMLILGLVFVSLFKKQISIILEKMEKYVGESFGWGAILMFLTPIAAIILMFTLIGIPLALITLGAWMLALCLGKIISGIFVGRLILKQFKSKNSDKLILAMTIGVIILFILFKIPFIGWAISLAAGLFGLGGIWLLFKKKQQQ